MNSFLGGMVGGFAALLLLAGLASLSWFYILGDVEDDFGELDEHNYEWADQELREVMLKVESYHRIFGFYPERLNLALGSTEGYDPLTQDCECGDSSDFFYQALPEGDSYSLFSKGPDCQPFTEDDHHLEISDSEKPNLGITSNYNKVAAIDANACKDTQQG